MPEFLKSKIVAVIRRLLFSSGASIDDFDETHLIVFSARVDRTNRDVISVRVPKLKFFALVFWIYVWSLFEQANLAPRGASAGILKSGCLRSRPLE